MWAIILVTSIIALFLSLLMILSYLIWWLYWITLLIFLLLLLLLWKPNARTEFRKTLLIKYLVSVVNIDIVKYPQKNIINSSDSLCVYAFHPHGYLSIAQMILFVFGKENTILTQKASNSVSLVSSVLLLIPIIGHFSRVLGCESVSKNNFIRHLKLKEKNIVLSPGGTREIMHIQESKGSNITLIKRKGFLELVYNYKWCVVPILVVGESSCHNFYWSGNKIQQWMQNTVLSYPLPVIAFGRYFSFWPKKNHDIKIYIGKQINSKKYNTKRKFIKDYYASIIALGKQNNIYVKLIPK